MYLEKYILNNKAWYCLKSNSFEFGGVKYCVTGVTSTGKNPHDQVCDVKNESTGEIKRNVPFNKIIERLLSENPDPISKNLTR